MQTKNIASSNNKEWVIRQKQVRTAELIDTFHVEAQMPSSYSAIYTFYKRNKDDEEFKRRLSDANVDWSRNSRVIAREETEARFIENYKQRGRLPAKSIEEERTDYGYWQLRKNDPDFLWLLVKNGVDICRSLEVVAQEKNFAQWLEFVRVHKDIPKDKRKQVLSKKTSDLPEKLKHEDFLRRWQYNVLHDKIACLSFCQVNIKQKVKGTIAALKEEEKALKILFRNAERHGTEYLRQAAETRYDKGLPEYARQEP